MHEQFAQRHSGNLNTDLSYMSNTVIVMEPPKVAVPPWQNVIARLWNGSFRWWNAKHRCRL